MKDFLGQSYLEAKQGPVAEIETTEQGQEDLSDILAKKERARNKKKNR